MSVSSLLGVVDVDSFGSSFKLVGVFPSSVLILFLLMLFFLWSDEPTIIPSFEMAVDRITALDLQQGALLILIVIILSLVIQPLQRPLIRLMEGYWGSKGLLGRLANIGIDIQRSKRRDLEASTQWRGPRNIPKRKRLQVYRGLDEATLRLREYYPKEDRLLPTSLGNVLRSAEDVAGSRYNLVTISAWSRLYPFLSVSVRSIVDEKRNQLDVAVRFSFVFMIGTVSSLIFYFGILYQASHTDIPFIAILNSPVTMDPPLWKFEIWVSLAIKYGAWLIIPAVTSVLSFLFYQGAIYVARTYGITLKSAFDTQRFELLKALHLQLPANSSIEKIYNKRLSAFLMEEFLENNEYYFFAYSHTDSNEDNGDEGENTKDKDGDSDDDSNDEGIKKGSPFP